MHKRCSFKHRVSPRCSKENKQMTPYLLAVLPIERIKSASNNACQRIAFYLVISLVFKYVLYPPIART